MRVAGNTIYTGVINTSFMIRATAMVSHWVAGVIRINVTAYTHTAVCAVIKRVQANSSRVNNGAGYNICSPVNGYKLSDAVQIFTDLKNDSIELTKEFRDTLREMLDDETIEGLRERIREMVCERVQNLSEMIRNRIRQHNRNRLCYR